jgi:hypothetical protein
MSSTDLEALEVFDLAFSELDQATLTLPGKVTSDLLGVGLIFVVAAFVTGGLAAVSAATSAIAAQALFVLGLGFGGMGVAMISDHHFRTESRIKLDRAGITVHPDFPQTRHIRWQDLRHVDVGGTEMAPALRLLGPSGLMVLPVVGSRAAEVQALADWLLERRDSLRPPGETPEEMRRLIDTATAGGPTEK